MILGYYQPERDFSWEELDTLSAKQEGMATWPQAMLSAMEALGFDITMVEGFDGHAFIERGGAYLQEAFGSEIAKWQIENSNIDDERELYKKAYSSGVDIQNRIPNIEDLKDYMAQGYFVACNVNSSKLNQKPGYVGHFILILDITDQEIVMHDPGLPAMPERHVGLDLFEQAWADPNDAARNFVAIRPKEKA